MRFAYLLFTPPVRQILTPDLTFFRERGICGTSRTSQTLGVTSSEKRHSISLHKDIAQEDISVNDINSISWKYSDPDPGVLENC